MTKIFRILILFLCVSPINKIKAQLPSFKEISIDIPARISNQVVFIPYVSDGNTGSQTVTITNAVSSNDTIVAVDSFSYDNQYHMGLLYITEFGYADTVNISITIDDGVDGAFTGDLTINVIDLFSNAFNGANYEYYDKAHYLPEPNEYDVPASGSYQVIPITNGPNENMQKDFFWQLMYGYIIPPITGEYVFLCEENEGGSFRMNLDDGISQDISDLTLLGEDDSSATMIETDSIQLQAGKPYFFRFTGKDIINSQPFWIKWVVPGNPLDTLFIDSTNLETDIDLEKPTIPQNFHAERTGVNFVYLNWEESTDNKGILGYNIYVNGELYQDSITQLNATIEGLSDSTEYTFALEAIDVFNLSSGFSEFINVTTYPIDTIKPNPPQNLTATHTYSHAVEITWDISTDTETNIWGYNIYFNDTLVNTDPIFDNYYLNYNILPETEYNIQVSAIDGGLNESDKSDTLTITTPYFSTDLQGGGWWPINAIVSFKTEAFDNFPGIGLQIKHDKSSILSSNKLPYGHFEDISFENGIDKDINRKDGNLTFEQSYNNPYSGKYSAKLSGNDGDSINCYINSEIHSDTFNYLIRFACRKESTFTGNVNIRLGSESEPNANTETITPTDNWQLYEIIIDPSYDGTVDDWYLSFSLEGGNGTIYLDEIEFHIAEHYIPGSKFSSKGIELIEEFNPSGIRWGGIDANKEEFSTSSGPYTPNTLSFADIVYLSNTYGKGYSFLSTGIADSTDWMRTDSIFSTFTDYLVGDSTTEGGALRISEGYNNLISDSKQIIIDIGNEVWGGISHYADIGSDYTEYGNWARSSALKMKESPFYNSQKIITAYSGKSPDYYDNLHTNMLTGDNNEVDWISISGYMGWNTQWDPETQSQFIKNSYSTFRAKTLGINGIIINSINTTGRNIPLYFYEGNLCKQDFYGAISQALLMTDYYTYAMRNGIEHAIVYNLYGGQWSLIKDRVNYEKYPLFYTSALVNKTCIGNSLVTSVVTNGTLEDGNGNTITDFDPIGAYAFNNNDNYTIALFSRDIDHTYRVKIDVPDDLSADTMAVIHTITGDFISDQDITYTIDTIYNFSDSINIYLPSNTMKVISFTANTFIPPYVPVESVSISLPTCGWLNVDNGYYTITAGVSPSNATNQEIKWTIVENEIGAICETFSGGLKIQGSGTCNGNGSMIVRACAMDDTTICDQVTIYIYGQEDDGGCDVISVSENEMQQTNIYPNPAQDLLNIGFNSETNAIITISNLQGCILISKSICNNSQIDISNLNSGLYIIKVESGKNAQKYKFIKE